MCRKTILTVALVAATTVASAAYEWENIKPEAKLGGRMMSAGYLRGKVVLLDRRDYGSMSQAAAIKQLQSIWATYKTKPFVVLGSHHGSSSKEKVEETLKKLGVTYPVYNDVRLIKPDANEQELAIMQAAWEKTEPTITIVDATCKRKLYVGKDDRASQGVVGSALMATSTPPSAKQYQFLLNYEIEMLPGRAFLRLKEFRERFPREAAKYAADWERMSEDGYAWWTRRFRDQDGAADHAGNVGEGDREVRRAQAEQESQHCPGGEERPGGHQMVRGHSDQEINEEDTPR